MLNKFLYLFLSFMIYSFLGYIIEITNCSIREKKLILNRGFFLGPYLPIYGISCLLMGLFILRYKNDLFTVFVMSAFISTTLEYVTSYTLEKIFKARWWDYTDHRFNIEGRVCLFNAFLFGLGGIAFVYLLYPFVTHLIELLPLAVFRIISIILLVIFLTDVIITITTLCQVKISTLKFKSKDVTMELTKIIRNELKSRKIKTNFFVRHMLNAFPKIDIKGTNSLSILKKYAIKKKK